MKNIAAIWILIFLVLAFFASLSVTFKEGNPYGLVFAGIIGYILYLIFKPSGSGNSSSSSNSYRPPSGSSYRSSGSGSYSSFNGSNKSNDDLDDDILDFMIMDYLSNNGDD